VVIDPMMDCEYETVIFPIPATTDIVGALPNTLPVRVLDDTSVPFPSLATIYMEYAFVFVISDPEISNSVPGTEYLVPFKT
jgi:hypothetical protein